MRIEGIEHGDWYARINLSRGASCIELVNRKYSASILRVPDYEHLDNPFLYGMPILFPVNRISGGSFEFEGRHYSLPINEPATGCALHGTLHGMEFSLKEKSTDRIVCSYIATKDKPYLTFPHELEIELEYMLDANGFKQITTVTNRSGENMPSFLGFHTTFSLPFIKGSSIENVRIKADIGGEFERGSTYLPTGRILDEDAVCAAFNDGTYIPIQKLSRHCKAVGNGSIELTDIKNHVTVTYKNDEKLPFRLIFGDGKSFICLEPQSCLVNAPNSPFDREFAGFDFIEPGASKSYQSEIRLGKSDNS